MPQDLDEPSGFNRLKYLCHIYHLTGLSLEAIQPDVVTDLPIDNCHSPPQNLLLRIYCTIGNKRHCLASVEGISEQVWQTKEMAMVAIRHATGLDCTDAHHPGHYTI